MNRRLLTILLSAFVVAAACSYLVYRVVGARVGAPQARTTRIVAAEQDLKIGTLLKNSDLTTIAISGALPQGAILKADDAAGRGVVSDMYRGEPILESRLAAKGSGGGLAATIPDGMRACAVKVDDVVGVAGFVTPGMRVDVLISGNPPGPVNTAEGPKVRTLLQNIQVLSAGADIQKNSEGKPEQVQVVNLLVTPEQAELLSLASNETHIQLVLRNPLDTKQAITQTTATATLYTDGADPKPRSVATPRAAPRPTAGPQVYLIEVFNGAKKSEEKLTADEGKQ